MIDIMIIAGAFLAGLFGGATLILFFIGAHSRSSCHDDWKKRFPRPTKPASEPPEWK